MYTVSPKHSFFFYLSFQYFKPFTMSSGNANKNNKIVSFLDLCDGHGDVKGCYVHTFMP